MATAVLSPSGHNYAAPSSSTVPALDATAALNELTKSRYIKDKKLGEGTYAVVHLGYIAGTTPPTPVAIKKIKISAGTDGLSMDAIREVKFLNELRHENVIRLIDVFGSKNQNLNLVLEYLDCDLEMLIKDAEGVSYGVGDIKSWIGMAARGLEWCHRNFVLHRDIKPNNLLLSSNGTLKLADFGLARSFSDPKRAMTSNVITRWYRPPELLFGAKFYSSAVDIWSLGVVFGELILRTPFLAGNTDMHQLSLIAQCIGTPQEENWPGVSKLPEFVLATPEGRDVAQPEANIQFFTSVFGSVGPEGVGLIRDMLRLDPRKRVDCMGILRSRWFEVEPRPTPVGRLPKRGGQEGEKKVAADLKRNAAWMDEGGRGKKVARKLDFGA